MQLKQSKQHRKLMICSSDMQSDTVEIDESLNTFQKKQWTKYGRSMPENWVDPFEVYDD